MSTGTRRLSDEERDLLLIEIWRNVVEILMHFEKPHSEKEEEFPVVFL
jgi:quinol monooxygenase YgiN